MNHAVRICFLLLFFAFIAPNMYAGDATHLFPSDSTTTKQNAHRSSDSTFVHPRDSSNSILFWDGYTSTGSDSSILIYQNYPNPFSGSTIILFQVADPTLYGEEINIIVYDERGNEMGLLYEDLADDAIHSVTFDGSFYQSGFY